MSWWLAFHSSSELIANGLLATGYTRLAGITLLATNLLTVGGYLYENAVKRGKLRQHSTT